MITFPIQALLATLGTWALTALGAAMVIFFEKPRERLWGSLLGFAAGVMTSAAFWSLLSPALARAEALALRPVWAVVSAGFLAGALFLLLCDRVAIRVNRLPDEQSSRKRRVLLLVLSITLHNIPEGLAVGVAFGALARSFSPEAFAGAVGLAVGIGLQNFPEGAAVALPLRREGYSRTRSFFWGQASGMVEPIAGLAGALLVVRMERILPFALAFAAGAMLFVVAHELLPEAQEERERTPYIGTMGFVLGFTAMMLLDISLG